MKALQEHRHRGDRDEQTEPAKPAPVSLIPAIPGHPEIGEGEHERERRRLDTRQISVRPERRIKRHCESEKPDEHVDDANLGVSDLAKQPHAVETQHGADIE